MNIKTTEEKQVFGSLIIFCRLLTWEFAWVICDVEQGDLFYSVGWHRNLRKPQLTWVKLRRGFGKSESEWIRKVWNRMEEMHKAVGRAVGKAAGKACTWPTPGFKGRSFELWVLNTGDHNFWSPLGSPSCGGDIMIYVKDINQPSLLTPFYSVLVSISVFMAFQLYFFP